MYVFIYFQIRVRPTNAIKLLRLIGYCQQQYVCKTKRNFLSYIFEVPTTNCPFISIHFISIPQDNKLKHISEFKDYIFGTYTPDFFCFRYDH